VTAAVDKARIRQVVEAVIDELNAQWPDRPPMEKSGSAVLFGRNGSLDSLGLVHFVVGVEQGLAETLGANVTLASDKAMARRHSPFRTIDSLVDFIAELLQEQAGA
jgi:acyl carrier protein